jgi:hypothetical protein
VAGKMQNKQFFRDLEMIFRFFIIPFVCALCLSGCMAFREPVSSKLPENILLSWTANTCLESLPVTASLVELIGE